MSEKTITIDEYTTERLDEIRVLLAEMEKLTGFRIDGFSGFDLKNDEHLIHSLIGTTSRMLAHAVKEAKGG